MLIVGEPGIGKSRLVEEFRARLGETPHTWVEWSSSQLLQNTPLHPITDGLIIIGGSVGRIYPYVASLAESALRADLRSEYQMPRIEMSELGDEGPALGAALILHQRMLSIDERAVFPKGGARGLIRMTSV